METTVEEKITREEWRARNPIRQWRNSQGMTQQDVAVAVGVGVRAVTSWELGEVSPSINNLGTIADLSGDKEIYEKWRSWTKLRASVE